MLKLFMSHLAPKTPFITKFYICCFNQSDKDRIVTGFKNFFMKDEVMTGKEFCDILRIDYDAIVKMRKDDTSDNFRYVVEKMAEIKDVRIQVSQKQRAHIQEDDFYNTDIFRHRYGNCNHLHENTSSIKKSDEKNIITHI